MNEIIVALTLALAGGAMAWAAQATRNIGSENADLARLRTHRLTVAAKGVLACAGATFLGATAHALAASLAIDAPEAQFLRDTDRSHCEARGAYRDRRDGDVPERVDMVTRRQKGSRRERRIK